MTIFGVGWNELTLERIEQFLAESGPEPLLWEAKGIRADRGEIRRQVCGFANSHDGGYLIIGADESDGAWSLDGVEFPDDPPLWISSVVGEGGVTPYPDGLDTRSFRRAEGRHVAVVRIPAIATPPCNTHGTVYERVSGRTISVREPLRLAALFERGDGARTRANDKAALAAATAMLRGIGHRDHEDEYIQFGLGVAAAGYAPDIASRLFSQRVEQDVRAIFEKVLQTDMLQPHPPILTETTQDSRILETERNHALGDSWSLRISWDGAVGIWWIKAITQTVVETLVDGPIRIAWTALEEILRPLGAKEPHYAYLTMAGGRFSPNPRELPQWESERPKLPIVSRGPLVGLVTDDTLASVERELRRAFGEMVYEPDPPK